MLIAVYENERRECDYINIKDVSGYHLKYNKDIPKDMFEIEKNGIIKRFKSKNAFVDFFKQQFPDKIIRYGQLTRNRKSVYGYKITVLNSLSKKKGDKK